MQTLTPRGIVAELDKHIVGQAQAKRAVAIALRNRWRRQMVEGDLRHEITPKNILMIGPTGVGKTEIARRLAKLADVLPGGTYRRAGGEPVKALHGWITEVMETPTPVSALLHAGIINLGGILLLCFAPLLSYSSVASTLLLAAALFSTILAALIMTTRISIKVRLAWSTVAQMGLMLVEIALGLYTLALLHLLAHSCYKAYAFLHSGNAVNHYLAAQLAEQTNPAARHWLLALTLAAAMVYLVQLLLPLSSLSSAVLLVLAISVLLTPSVCRADKRRPMRVLLALGYALALLALYFALKTLLRQVLPTPEPVALLADVITSLAFAALFVLAILLRYHSQHKTVNKLFIWLNAGGYLDEWATRITLQIWPYHARHTAPHQHSNSLQEIK